MRAKRVWCMVLVSSFLSAAAFPAESAAYENAETQVAEDVQYEEQDTEWEFVDVELECGEQCRIGVPFSISADVKGTKEGLQYKFVIANRDWSDWQVIRDFSEEPETSFVMDRVGEYQIYVDVKGMDGTIVSRNMSCEFVSAIWTFDGISVSESSPQPVNTDGIEIIAKTSGDTEDLEYKYVWMKDGWKSWGVIKDFSSDDKAVWKPSGTGRYTIYADVRDMDGKIKTETLVYDITDVFWDFDGVTTVPEKAQNPDAAVSFQANVSGNTKGMEFKFVWMRDEWESWGVIRDFSSTDTAETVFSEPGDYTIYIDVKDWKGNITTQTIPYRIMTDVWEYKGISTDLASPQEKYTVPIKISAEVTGKTDALEYKFVWQKNGWSKWGVIEKFSGKKTAEWYPEDIGIYTLYVDIKDADGRIETKEIPYIISRVNWNADGVASAPEEVQKKGKTVQLKAQTSGNTVGLQYKFVWMKDNWKEWGVIRDFSEDSSTEWKTPDKSGQYEIYVDVKDRDGEIRTVTEEYFVATQLWTHEGVDVNNGVSEQIYTEIPVEACTSGETDNLQYKFVWMKDGWKEWGVIRDFNEKSSAVWYPKTAGTYYIYSDVRDVDGRIQTVIEEYVVKDAPWKLKQLKAEGSGSYFVGSTTTVTALTEGETEGLKYKFVQQNGDNWNNWKVLQNFSESNQVDVTISVKGNCHIYVDIMDQRGVIFDSVKITLSGLVYNSAGVSEKKVSLGKSVTVYPNVEGGSANGMECRYVWMKDNWNCWNVIKDYSASRNVSWTPPETGTYYIYIDVRLNGQVKTQTVTLSVVKEKNGWYYENGYKFYYSNDRKVEDVRGIIGAQSSYEIKINKQMSCVTVYAKDGSNGYIIPVVAFACSPGAGTPLGTFYTQNKYRWHNLYGADGQFCTRITGHVLFHSPPYSSFNNHTLWPAEYNKLGTWASSGCIRLRTGDAMWIYENCSLGTKVTIYNSSVAGPFSKPVYAKIPLWQTWDPTDPYA